MVCDGQGYALLGGDVGDGHHALGHMGNSQRDVLLAASGSVHAIEVDGGAVQVEVAPGSTGSFRDKLARRRRARVFRDRGCAKGRHIHGRHVQRRHHQGLQHHRYCLGALPRLVFERPASRGLARKSLADCAGMRCSRGNRCGCCFHLHSMMEEREKEV